MSITTYTTDPAIKKETPENIGAYEGPQEILKTYHIFHCINKKYTGQEVAKQPRKYVGFVLAPNIHLAFEKAQDLENVRSTSVGDLIQDSYGFYMVKNKGFELLCLVDEEGRE